MRKIHIILISFLLVFILCSISYQPAIAKTSPPAIENNCNCPTGKDDRVPIVLCVLLSILVFIPIPLLWLSYIILSIGYMLFPDLVDWEEIYDYINYDLYFVKWFFPIVALIYELGCFPYETPKSNWYQTFFSTSI